MKTGTMLGTLILLIIIFRLFQLSCIGLVQRVPADEAEFDVPQEKNRSLAKYLQFFRGI
jgi:hypothetical protein